MPRIAKTWQLVPHDRHRVDSLAKELGISWIVALLLLNRGIGSREEARRFLDAPLSGLHKPQALPGVEEAARRLLSAIRAGKRIMVYGDYDVDGTAGTAILWQGLRLLGGQADFYVPHRLEEGYGLNAPALKQIAQSGASVLVTVDCGIASLAEAEEARKLGLELIITDHHECKESLPQADVIVHPRLPGSTYPFGGISGAGVALKLAWALCQQASGSERVPASMREYLLESVALAALGLVADVVPLLDENRILVRHGLARLQSSPSPGVSALLETASLKDKSRLSAGDVGYRLAPRLNAAGRLGSARLVIELLTTTSQQRAQDLARFLEGQNTQRQQFERRILAQAREHVEALDLDSIPAIVLADADWHPGIIGIVASRLVDMYGRPTLLISIRDNGSGDGELGYGSGRSVPGLALHEALRACGDQLISHGGHAAAAGFKIRPENIGLFRESFCSHVSKFVGVSELRPGLVIDAEVPLNVLTVGLVQELDRLEPYGSANRRPLFLASDLRIQGEPKCVGAGERHVSFRVSQQAASGRCIAFNMADRLPELLSAGGACSLVFTPKPNEWRGMRQVDLEVVDWQPSPRPRLG